MRCEEIRELLPAYEPEQQPSLAVRRHLASCPDCRAEVETYKELAAGLRDLRHATVEVPASLSRSLEVIPGEAGVVDNVRIHVARNRAAYVGGAVALAGAVGATLWRVRSRRLAAA